MLSIGKLGADQARYYLDQAQGRVDVVDSVGDGIEDYYVGGAEARGEWIGAAARELGLHGPVEGEALRRVLAGLHPSDGSLLRSSSSPARVGGFDLTFSAPKSVSVLFGVGDEGLQGRVRVAHDVATRAAVAYLEGAAAVRRGHGGLVVEEASGFVAAAFRHRTSRAGDPQLHTHVLVANLGRGADGRWSALDGRRLYAHARTASFIYQAVLRSELTRTVGVEWSPVRKGIADVIGVRRRVLDGFSRRRAEIEAALEQRGTSGARAAEAAALATRRPKDSVSVAQELTGEWRTRAAELGLGRSELALIIGRARSKELGEREWDRLFARLAGLAGLTHRKATFTRDEVLQAVCVTLRSGARVDRASLEAAADRFLASEHVIALVADDEQREGEAFRRRDGRVLPVDRQQLRYSTRAHLQLEQELIYRVVAARRGDAGVATEDGLARSLSSRPTMTAEQRTVVERLCRDGDGVAVLAGRPGTGKTFALAAAREAWQSAGHPVIGAATARRAAAELQDGAGIQSTSTFALLADLRTRGRPMPARCVLVVDEAGMVPTREIAELLDAVLAVDGKVVLVGDHRQLPELQAGGTFRALVQRGLALELRENVRQVHAWEREALDQLRDGEAEHALGAYVRHDRVIVEPTADATRARLVEDWFAAGDLGRAVMIAHRRVDVADLNSRARERMRAAGQLGPEIETPAGSFAVGDHVVIKRHDHRREINNGDRGRVIHVDPTCGAIGIDLRCRRIQLDRRFLAEPTAAGDPPLMHAYAITGHIAQGLTVEGTYVLATDGIDREWTYVALSRGRNSNRLYLSAEADNDRAEYAPVGPTPDPLERLARQLERSSAEVLAIDSGQRIDSVSLDQATRERQRLEQRRFGWLPTRRQELEAARAREADVRRELLERQHRGRPFATDAEWRERLDRQHERELERATERVLRRERGMGREL